jgi:hypothetical protein
MNLSLLSTVWFDYGSSKYYQSLALRNQVLRKPIHLQFSNEQLATEKLFNISLQVTTNYIP